MNENKDKDKELLKNLDQILEGRDEEVFDSVDEDTRTALEFVGKMASLREKPSDEFTKNLKAELVHRLAEQENRRDNSDSELLFWGISRRKLWQGTIAALITFIVGSIIFIIFIMLD